MPNLTTANGKAAYEADFYAWSMGQAAALRARDLESLDFENLAEEVEGLGRSDRRELRNRLIRVLEHLLKCQFQPARHSRSWEKTLIVQRTNIAALVEDSPSLRRELPQMIERAYTSAQRIAAKEMRLEQWSERFPATCPWSVEQILDADFYPAPSK